MLLFNAITGPKVQIALDRNHCVRMNEQQLERTYDESGEKDDEKQMQLMMVFCRPLTQTVFMSHRLLRRSNQPKRKIAPATCNKDERSKKLMKVLEQRTKRQSLSLRKLKKFCRKLKKMVGSYSMGPMTVITSDISQSCLK